MASKDRVFYSKKTLNVNGNLLDLSSPKIMGILNVTEDSFYDGGNFMNEKEMYFWLQLKIPDSKLSLVKAPIFNYWIILKSQT